MESSMNRDEHFRTHQSTYLMHANLVQEHRMSLDRIIKIQAKRKARRERPPSSVIALD